MVTGVSLSRWTMSYFAAALVALLLAEGLMAAGYGYPSASVESPRTLIVVHIVTIGWLSLLMCGALFQVVPVLIHPPLFNNVLTMPALLCLLGGLVALLSGFLWLDGQIGPLQPFARSAQRPWSRVLSERFGHCTRRDQRRRAFNRFQPA